jgi:hypothetical protein
VIQLKRQTLSSKRKSLPQVEMHFATLEHAQKAASLLDSSNFDNPQVSISEMLFEDRGRRLILKFNSSSVLPSDLVAFVFDVVDAVSAAHPLTREVNIPLVHQ